MVVEIIQTSFREVKLADEAAWQAVFLIPKGWGDYGRIVLMEVIWKTVAVILNRRFAASITYH